MEVDETDGFKARFSHSEKLKRSEGAGAFDRRDGIEDQGNMRRVDEIAFFHSYIFVLPTQSRSIGGVLLTYRQGKSLSRFQKPLPHALVRVLGDTASFG